MIELDHVLIAVTDLDAAGREFEARHGLASVAGGRHPGWGTANRIVPLGDTYLELVAAVDTAEAAGSPFGRWVAAAPSGRPLGWAVRTQELDVIAGRLGLAGDHGLAPTRGRPGAAVASGGDGAGRRRGGAAVLHRVGRRHAPARAGGGRSSGRTVADRPGPTDRRRRPLGEAGWERITSQSPCRRGCPPSPASCWPARAIASRFPAPADPSRIGHRSETSQSSQPTPRIATIR